MTIRTLEQAEKVAARRNKKKAQRWPLLALMDEIEQTTAEDVIEADRRFEKWMADQKTLQSKKAEKYRALLANAVNSQTIATLDDEWSKRRFGIGDEYRIEFWWRAIVTHAPDVAYRECPNRQMHEGFLAKWHEKCPACDKILK